MITANMHEAKSRLSALVKAVEEDGETVILCRNGKEVATIQPWSPATQKVKRLPKPTLTLKVKFAPGYDPTEAASEEEWPSEYR
ncbi:MAG: type II toxin-antitoxin system Phd/YefM family antitoxin [Verrucomicrobiota bacterium]